MVRNKMPLDALVQAGKQVGLKPIIKSDETRGLRTETSIRLHWRLQGL